MRAPGSLLALALGAALGCGAGGAAPAEGPRAVPVEIATAAVEPVDVVVEAVGSLRADQVIDVMPKRAGHVRELALVEGQRVDAGTVLVRLDDAELRAQVDQARAALVDARARADNARRQYERTKALFAEGIAARQLYDDARAELDRAVASVGVADANLAYAEAQLADTVIRAPFSGVLGQRRVDVGAFVKDGEPLVSLVDLDPMEVVFAVPERYLARLRTGQPVDVRVVSHGDRPFTGTVGFIDPQVDPVNRTVTVKAVIPNAEGALRPGQFSSVRLTLERRERAVVVPEEAIVPIGERTLVYVVADGQAAARPVHTGTRLAGRVEVTDGLAAGETVVRTGHEKLRPDAPQAVAPVAVVSGG